MFCQNCGTKLDGNEEFCLNCGTKLIKNSNQINSDINGLKVNNITNNEFKGTNNDLSNVNINSNSKKKINKKVFIILGLIILLIAVSLILYKIFSKEEQIVYEEMNYNVVLNDDGIPKFIDGAYNDKKVRDATDALESLESIKDLMHITDINKEFEVISEEKSADITYYKLQQMYNNTKIYGQQLIISVDKYYKISSLSGEYIPNIEIINSQLITEEEALNVIKDKYDEEIEKLSCDKYIYLNDNKGRYVYIIAIASAGDLVEYIIDAESKEIIKNYSLFNDVAYNYTGKGLLDIEHEIVLEKISNNYQDKIDFFDASRNITISDSHEIVLFQYEQNDRGKFDEIVDPRFLVILLTANPISGFYENGELKYIENSETGDSIIREAVSGMKYFEEAYDYYKNILDRNSYDDNGGKISVNINVRAKKEGEKIKWENSAWVPIFEQFFIGESNGISFAVSKDVIGHEFTHAVISHTANFVLSPPEGEENLPFETGSLNEAYADILGSLIEGEDFTIAEDTGSIIRDIANPEKYENPKEMGGKYYYPDYWLIGKTLEQYLSEENIENLQDKDNGGEHHNSTVVSHAAYLMYERGAFKSKEEMAKVWYNSLFLLHPAAKFEDCALTVIKTASNLGLNEESIDIIKQAFYDVKILEEPHFALKGVVQCEDEPIQNVEIILVNVKNNELIYKTASRGDGSFNISNINRGEYKITLKKDGYNAYNEVIEIKENLSLNFEMTKLKKGQSTNVCDDVSYECRVFTMYTLDTNKKGELVTVANSFPVKYGDAVGSNYQKMLKKTFGDSINFDGESITIDIGIPIDMTWYYYGTDEKFNWSTPIYEDTEVEMKILGGFLDNDLIGDIYDMFSE